ncbi:5-formyltetrahydrofolate cyclo-ligase [Candidatus Woesearchaeota archaeon]|nr:5-formyltetrahydrofolate cyclo-ligase [Candidatus Woesearchaeota archaeon]
MKPKLRKKILELRRKFNKKDLSLKNKKISENIEGFDIFARSKTILFYVSFENEVRTHNLIKDSLKKKKTVIVPFLENKEICLSELKDFDELEHNKFGILEPKRECLKDFEIGNIDLIIVPGVVFDMKGHRIGFGMGCYDKLLMQSDATKIGLCYEFQILDKIPEEAHDVPVDFIVTEKRILKTGLGQD